MPISSFNSSESEDCTTTDWKQQEEKYQSNEALLMD